MKILETERLILRPWNRGDYLDLHEITSDERVAKFCGCSPAKDIEKSKKIVESYIKHKASFAIELKDKGKVIGRIGMDDITDGGKEKYIGYALNSEYWGRGYMPESINAFKEYLFQQLDVKIIWSSHYDFNNNSKRVLEKCGFKHDYHKENEHFYKIGR